MNTLYATDIRHMLLRLKHAEEWISKVRAESAPNQSHRFHFIDDELAEVRNTLLRASCVDVAVETTDAA